jgi:hypothetical protein
MKLRECLQQVRKYLNRRASAANRPEATYPRRGARPVLEALEDRICPNAVSWISTTSGNWNVASNWLDSTNGQNRVPTAADDVIINQPGITVTVNDAESVNSVTASTPITLATGGTLSVAGAFSDTSPVSLSGGTLANASVQTGTVLQGSGGVSGVTLAGTLDDNVFGGSVTVTNGLTINSGLVEIADVGSLNFSGTQDLAGTGEVLFNGTNNPNNQLIVEGSGTLTIETGITIDGLTATIKAGSGAIDNYGTLSVGSSIVGSSTGTPSNASLSGGTFNIEGAWINQPGATMQAVNDGNLALIAAGGHDPGGNPITNGVWMNDAGATMSVTGNSDDGGSLSLEGNGWSNAGTISMTNSSVYLGATFTLAALGTFTRTGGTVYLTGTLNNTGTLALDNTTGSWDLDGGTINGGTISTPGTDTTSGTVMLVVVGSGSVLNGIMLAGQLDDTGSFTVTNGMTLSSGLVETTTTASLNFSGGNQSLTGTGEVLFSVGNTNSGIDVQGSGTLTIASAITIDGLNATITADGSGAAIDNYGTLSVGTSIFGSSTGTPSSASLSGGTFNIEGAWINEPGATMQAVNDGNLALIAAGGHDPGGNPISNGVWMNDAGSTMSVTGNGGGSLSLEGNGWSNAGTITMTNSSVFLGGSFTLTALGSFSRSGGTVNLTGTLTDTGTTLALTSAGSNPTGTWLLEGGTIIGGTITTSGTAQLGTNGGSSTLEGPVT